MVPLPAPGVDGQNVCARLLRGHLGCLVTFVARGLLEMRTVSEIVQAERRSEAGAVLHRFGLLDVTGGASRQFVAGLMAVAGVTLRMLRHACLEALIVELVTEVASGRAFGHVLRVHLVLHLLRVRVIAMRKPLESEFTQPRREFDPRSLGIKRRLVADDAHLAFFVCEVLGVTFDTSRMSWKNRFGVVIRAQVAGGTVLSLALVLFAIVIEG